MTTEWSGEGPSPPGPSPVGSLPSRSPPVVRGVGAGPRCKLPREWASAVVQSLERESAIVRIVVAQVRGSAPREPGAFMLVGRDGVEGTIGGGRLEWESIAAARELLHDRSTAARLNTVVLGADLGQCCGGVVAVWLERFSREDVGFLRLVRETGGRGSAALSSTIQGASVERQLVCVNGRGSDAVGADLRGGGDAAATAAAATRGADAVTQRARLVAAEADTLLREPRGSACPRVVRDATGGISLLERLDDEFPALWLYGAGHVGQALAKILAELPLRLTWIDSRAELFPSVAPDGVRIRSDADSLATVSDAPAGTYFLVMTHSHPLDFALCQAILERNDFAWLGLIGSDSKAARFRSRLKKAGVPREVLAGLVCPIGVSGIESKWPAAIAVGVAAQVMQQISAAAALDCDDVGRDEHAGRPAALLRSGKAGGVTDCDEEKCSTCGTAGVASRDANGVSQTPQSGASAGGTSAPKGSAGAWPNDAPAHASEADAPEVVPS